MKMPYGRREDLSNSLSNSVTWCWTILLCQLFIICKISVHWAVFLEYLPSIRSFGHVLLFVTPWTAARQASLSITNSQSLLKLMSIESMMPCNHLNLCHPLLLLPSVFSSIRERWLFSSESILHIRWPKCWSFSFSMNIHDWPPFGWTGLISLQSKGWALQNWWLWTVVLEKTLKSALDCSIYESRGLLGLPL